MGHRPDGWPWMTFKSFHVSASIKELGRTHTAPSVKPHRATIRRLFDERILGQAVEINPDQAVRGPKHVVKNIKTPVLDQDEATALLPSIDATNIVGLRDRAIIASLSGASRLETNPSEPQN
jgi:integrase/recombinase XerD